MFFFLTRLQALPRLFIRSSSALLVSSALVFVGAGLVACGSTRSSEKSGEQSASPTPVKTPASQKTPPTASIKVAVKGGLQAVDDATPPHAGVHAMLAPLAKKVNERANRVVGEIDGPMKRGKPESAMGNFVTDAMRDGLKDLAGAEVDACFTNAGGLRVDFDEGKVTEGMVVELMPFENAVVILQMNGARLRRIMARLAQRGDPVSGISYKRTRAGGKGYRAEDIKVDGKPLGDQKVYKICTNDYVYEGGGRFEMEDIKEVRNTGILIRDLILHAFEEDKKAHTITHPAVEGRVQEAS